MWHLRTRTDHQQGGVLSPSDCWILSLHCSLCILTDIEGFLVLFLICTGTGSFLYEVWHNVNILLTSGKWRLYVLGWEGDGVRNMIQIVITLSSLYMEPHYFHIDKQYKKMSRRENICKKRVSSKQATWTMDKKHQCTAVQCIIRFCIETSAFWIRHYLENANCCKV